MPTDARPPGPAPADTAGFHLAQFDAVQAVALDPSVRAANLAALHDINPDLATRLAAIVLPAEWRAVRGLDGTPTFRIEAPGQAPAWLSGTAAPDTRARGMLDGYDPLGKNPLLPTAGAGGEIRFLLGRLPQHMALYVLERDAGTLAAILHLVDAAAAIRDYRLILVPPDREARYLTELLEREPGLLPPGTILTPTLVDAERMAEVQRLCERVYTESTLARQRGLLAAQQVESQRVIDTEAAPRLAVVGLRPDRAAQTHITRILEAAESLGCATRSATLRTPLDAHPLAHVARLSQFSPTLCIWAGHDPAALPATIAGRHAIWVQALSGVPTSFAPDVTYLAATPRIERALRDAGAPDHALAPWYWGADDSRGALQPLTPATSNNRVVVVGNLPALSEDALELSLDSQRMLWNHIRRLVRSGWETELVVWPERVLSAAEKASRYTIRDEGLRTAFLGLIAEHAIPGEVLLQTAAALQSAGRSVAVIGSGWRATEEPNVAVLADDVTLLPLDEFSTLETAPRGLVFAGAVDPLSPALVELATCGLPIAMHAPAGSGLSAALNGVIDPKRDLHVFATRQQLLEGIESFAAPAALRRAERLRAHVRQSHTWTSRVRELLALFAPGA